MKFKLTSALFLLVFITACVSTSPKPETAQTSSKTSPGENEFPKDKMQPIEEILEPIGAYDSKEFMKVAAVQRLPKEDAVLTWTAKQTESYKQRNRLALEKEVVSAATHGAKIVVLPEFAVTGYPDIPNAKPEEDNFQSREELKNFVEKIPGTSSNFFGKISKKYKIWIQYGLAEVDPKSGIYYNAAVVVDPNGKIVAHYRKQNLFGIEGKSMEAGKEIKTFMTPVGKMGIVICADTYKDSVLDQYKEEKVDVLLNSSSWASFNSAIGAWTKAAKRVGAYMVSSNDAYAPDVAIQNPDGTIQSHARQTPNVIVYGYLPLKK